ncbi:Putative two-component sensor histidine kinase [hydrothermal vent metagenome]|uniref:Putative two-component sensor histidine kinase n=1 Tax=hydrothermal vent metagenome TaxID=652676 RepID=A0A1W1BNU9_9ZZZZ
MPFSNKVIRKEITQFKEIADMFNALEFGCSKYKDILERKNDYLEAILYGTVNIILLKDSNKNILYLNRQFYNYFPQYKNITSFKKRHSSISELFDSDDKRYIDAEYYHKNFDYIVTDEIEHKVKITQNEKTSFFKLTVSKSELNKKYFVLILADITKLELERKKNILHERMLQQQAKMASMGEMIANIAHQWRQPLNALSVINVLMHRKYDIDELSKNDMDSFKEKTNSIIKKMNSTIDDFMNFFSPERKSKQRFSIADAINSTISFMGNPYLKNYIKLINRNQPDIEVIGYRGELEQVILNIIKNSRDAIKEQRGRQLMVTIDVIEIDDMVRIEIADNAGGVDEKIIDRVCEPYFTTKFESEGTGIGLYMSKMIIEKSMGGSFRLQNRDEGVVAIIEIKRDIGMD